MDFATILQLLGYAEKYAPGILQAVVQWWPLVRQILGDVQAQIAAGKTPAQARAAVAAQATVAYKDWSDRAAGGNG